MSRRCVDASDGCDGVGSGARGSVSRLDVVLQAGIDRLGNLSVCETEVKRDRDDLEAEMNGDEYQSDVLDEDKGTCKRAAPVEDSFCEANFTQALNNMIRISDIDANVDSQVIEFLFKLQLLTAFEVVDQELGFGVTTMLLDYILKHGLPCTNATVGIASQFKLHSSQEDEIVMSTGVPFNLNGVVSRGLGRMANWLRVQALTNLPGDVWTLAATIVSLLPGFGLLLTIPIARYNAGEVNAWAFQAAGGNAMNNAEFANFLNRVQADAGWFDGNRIVARGQWFARGAGGIWLGMADAFFDQRRILEAGWDGWLAKTIFTIFGPVYRNPTASAAIILVSWSIALTLRYYEQKWEYLTRKFAEFDLGPHNGPDANPLPNYKEYGGYLNAVKPQKRTALITALDEWRAVYNRSTNTLRRFTNPAGNDWVQPGDANYYQAPPTAELRSALADLRYKRQIVYDQFIIDEAEVRRLEGWPVLWNELGQYNLGNDLDEILGQQTIGTEDDFKTALETWQDRYTEILNYLIQYGNAARTDWILPNEANYQRPPKAMIRAKLLELQTLSKKVYNRFGVLDGYQPPNADVEDGGVGDGEDDEDDEDGDDDE
jgi:hypothetical protein